VLDYALQVAPLPARGGRKRHDPGADLRPDRAGNCECTLSAHLAIYVRTIVTRLTHAAAYMDNTLLDPDNATHEHTHARTHTRTLARALTHASERASSRAKPWAH